MSAHPVRVLLIEDNPGDARLIEEFFAEAGSSVYEVATADRLESGLSLLSRRGADLLLLDLTLPDSAGLDTLLRVRIAAKGVPTIVVTGLEDEEVARGALRAGAQDYLVKGRLDAMVLTRAANFALERKAATDRLIQSELRRSAILEASPDCIIAVDDDGKIIEFNAAAEKTFGYRSEDVVAKEMAELIIPPAFREGHRAGVARYQSTGKSTYLGRATERVATRADGTEFPVDLTVVPFTGGGVSGMLGVLRDLTEHKRLEQQLLQARKMDSLGRLAGGIAHDFNNMLSVILGWTGLVLDDLPADSPMRVPLEEVLHAGQGAANLTHQLLAFSRHQVMALTVFDANALVAETEKMLRRLVGEDIAFQTILEPQLWCVKMDRGQLGQVLMNLAVNARDAMPRGGTLTIETANVVVDAAHPLDGDGVEDGEYVMLGVADSGSGMSEDVRAHLFEPFFSTKASGKGTGLGLATCHGIVTQAGGHIAVATEVGRGTTMTVYMPRSREAAAEAARVPEPGEALRGDERILLVEDQAAVRFVTSRMLTARGWRVVSVGSGEEALRGLEDGREPPDLLLTDVVLAGGMNGPEVARRAIAVRPGLKVLFISGYASDVTIQHGLHDGTLALLPKPFTAESLARKVREVLDAR